MPSVKTALGSIYYEEKGQGEPLVILRGLGRNIRHWLGFDDLLAQDFRVISIDNRGFGGSSAPLGWQVTMESLARDVVRVLDELAIDRAHVMGVSLGGMIALAMGIYFPERCANLVIVNSSIGGRHNMRITPAALYVLGRYGHDKKQLPGKLAEVLVSHKYAAKERKAMVKAWHEIEEKHPTSVPNVIKQLKAAITFWPANALKKLAIPTLVVYGADDKLCPPRNSLAIHHLIPGARLVKINDAGHELMTDKPRELRDLMRDFFAERALPQKAVRP